LLVYTLKRGGEAARARQAAASPADTGAVLRERNK
jgi:hypothetical protein